MNQQQEAVAHDDNTTSTQYELQGMIRGFQKALNWMVTMMERMTIRPKNNPLPQKRQEEPKCNKVWAGRKNTPPQKRLVEPWPKRHQVSC